MQELSDAHNYDREENAGKCFCDPLGDNLRVYTGRDEIFPGAFKKLIPVSEKIFDDESRHEVRLLRCPGCGAFFKWIDIPQFYGSGNLDEEQLVRLTPKVSGLFGKLFSAEWNEHINRNEAERYFQIVPFGLLMLAFKILIRKNSNHLAPFVPDLIRLLSEKNNSPIPYLLRSFTSGNPEKLERITLFVPELVRLLIEKSNASIWDSLLDYVASKPERIETVVVEFRALIRRKIDDSGKQAQFGLTLPGLINFGTHLAAEFMRESEKYHFKDSRSDNWQMGAAYIEKSVIEISDLLKNPGTAQKIENCPLLANAVYPDPAATLEEREDYFTRLSKALTDFARSHLDWDSYYTVNRQKCAELWEIPVRLRREHAEKQRQLDEEKRLREREQKAKFAADLVEAKEKFSQPPRRIQCFAETRSNNLNCNGSDLITVKKFPPSVTDNRKIEITVRKCGQCRQLYKEIFETDEVTKKSRNHFLKPGETDSSGIAFSIAEAEEYDKIDFAGLINPLLESEKPATKDEEKLEKIKNNVLELEIRFVILDTQTNTSVDFGVSNRKDYHFQIPPEWFVGRQIAPEKIPLLLDFVGKHELKRLKSNPNYVFKVQKYEQKYLSPEDWTEEGYRTIFLVRANGEIEATGTARITEESE